MSRSDFAGRVRARVGLGLEVAALLERVHVGLRAVGQPALGPQHLVQAVAALAAEDPDGQVERHVVGMVARDAELPDADLRLHRVRLVDDDHAPRRIRRLDEPLARHVARSQSPNTFLTASNASSAVTSPTIARIALFGAKYFW